MELGVLERVVLLQLLPSEGDYITFKILQDLKLDLGLSEEDIKEFEVVQDVNAGTLVWNKFKEKSKEIKIGDKAKSIIKDALNKLDSEGKINQNNASLYEKFVVDSNV